MNSVKKESAFSEEETPNKQRQPDENFYTDDGFEVCDLSDFRRLKGQKE